MEPLIPGLPDDIARECLFRVHYTQLSTLCSVSKAWKSVLLSREFRLHREQHCNAKQLVLLKCMVNEHYKFILLELHTNIWSELPPIPEFPNGLPLRFKYVIASFKWGFVVVGADFYRNTIPFCNKVYVFDYLSATWQRKANMPPGDIYAHGCTSDRDRSVYVFFRNHRTQPACIMVYDVMKDEWSSRINTEKEDWYHMMYQSGKIHFYGGHQNSNKRVLNVSTKEWEKPQHDFKDKKSLYMCLNEDGEWYSFRDDRTLALYKDFTWKVILKPQEFDVFYCNFAMWKNKVLFIREEVSKQMKVTIVDLENNESTTICGPREFRRALRTYCCYLEI